MIHLNNFVVLMIVVWFSAAIGAAFSKSAELLKVVEHENKWTGYMDGEIVFDVATPKEFERLKTRLKLTDKAATK